jgi:hypothetical protein
MGRDKHEKERHKDRLPPFVPLLIDTLNQPAWRAMEHGAQMLYVAVKRRYSPHTHNNGKIFLSQRMAATELHSHHNQIARWFRELQHFGFVVMQTAGFLGVEGKGQAPRWRLTELGYMNEPPTRNYARWDGTPFVDQVKSRARKPARSVPESTHTVVQENRTVIGRSVPENLHKETAAECAVKPAQNYITTPPKSTDHDGVVPCGPRPSPMQTSQDEAAVTAS